MSTSSTEPTPVPAETTNAGATETTDPTVTSASEGTLANVEPTESGHGPGFITRHTTTLITLMVAVIVAALATTGVVLWRNHVDGTDADTEAAVVQALAAQGATAETVDCSGDTCTAIINGQAYTVLVQEDDNGDQHFGVTSYVGD